MNNKQKIALFQIVFSAIILATAVIFLNKQNAIAQILCIFSCFIAGYKIFLKILKNFLKFQLFDENFLMCMAATGAFFINEPVEAAIIIIFYQIGEFFQNLALYKSKQSIKQLMQLKPKFTILKTKNGIKKTEVEKIKTGEIIVIKPGEKIPLDGKIVSGNSKIDTAPITGESIPKNVKPGDIILSGCINLTSKIELEVETTFQNCTVNQMLKFIEIASQKKSKQEQFISKFAKIYTPVVVILALFTLTLPTIFFAQNLNLWLKKAIILITISCPCALVISIPLSFFSTISAAAKNLVLIKGSQFIDILSKVKVIAFDKTGTLTQGKFEIVKLNPKNSTENELLKILAVAESLSNHPIATAIKTAYYNKFRQQIENIKELQTEELAGFGIKTTTNTDVLLAGNSKLMKKFKINFEQTTSPYNVVYLAKNKTYMGNIVIADKLKPKTDHTIENLKKLGIQKIAILTGDNAVVTEKVARSLKLKTWFAELIPSDKVKKIQYLKKQGPLIFIGDGINDAPALCSADVGIAIGKCGTDAAIEAADVVLMDSNLNKINQTILMARKTLKTISQNIFICLSIKFLILLIEFFYSLNIWLAIFADVGTSTIAVFNSLKLLKTKFNLKKH